MSTLSPIHSRLSAIKSHQSQVRIINATQAAGDEDLLKEIGYKQELNRKFKTYQIFGIAYSVMGILPGVASVSSLGLAGGPAAFVWGWFITSIMILTIAAAMSENGNYGLAEEILAIVVIQKDGNFDVTEGRTYAVFAAGVIVAAIGTCVSSRNVATLQTVSGVANTLVMFIFLVALPIGASNSDFGRRDAKFIFGKVKSYSDWSTGWQFCLAWMAAIWSIGAFDSPVHMSEEAQNATYGVPLGIISAVAVCAFGGWACVLCLVACMKPDVAAVLDTETGFPFAQICYDALGKKWAVAIMSLTAVCQWLCAASILTALSRQIWAFARDNGLPFSSIVKVVNKRLRVPIRAVIFATVVALLIGCLCLAGPTAANALFSLGVSGNYVSWSTPTLLRLTSGRSVFRPGAFYLGKVLSPIVGWISCVWTAFVLVLCMFPSNKKVEKDTMNYNVVISCGVWILSFVYFFVYKYKHFHGPRSNLDDDDEQPLSVDVVMEEKKA
ncbi:hypothetical protein KL949_000656 [Ogataea haglerorum]|uniref:uncharacterized protein n=1 Tax=Ogataea haglerorum TaxID=1937702 RepID=UPI001C8AC2CD|nr:uncharacterized protein KL911_003367 [Ogataea haglerorum]KAG7722291.1 hypothetical protein KL913_000111 [Ogataea haglerorum]KAG7723606.1 hypothetical protein KL949_000656 [Ogataea haglerorum]KAG7752636.1 hypothetical protein KL911_003367 [Ogataea haglerorum]KAG7771771.1 hypothetical protein KL931_000111 [Ogataea haglerorum]KAG7803816.1 hypothetical protein KL944_000685 [Ogataea haglerorum]